MHTQIFLAIHILYLFEILLTLIYVDFNSLSVWVLSSIFLRRLTYPNIWHNSFTFDNPHFEKLVYFMTMRFTHHLYVLPPFSS